MIKLNRGPLAVLLLALSLLACTDSGDTGLEKERTVDAAAASAKPAAEDRPSALAIAREKAIAAEKAELLTRGAISMTETWTGDLDAMEEKRTVRILTVYGSGRFYLEDGRDKGIIAELATRLEKHVNRRLRRKHIRVRTIVVPVARNQLLPALLAGRGDIVAADLTITDTRLKSVDFTIPYSKPLNEILVVGPAAPPLESLDDLSGQTVYLRVSSSYYDSIQELSAAFLEKGLEPIRIVAMPEALEDDDLIEMVNAGLLPWAIVDDYKPQLWEGVFQNLTVRNDLVVRRGGRTAWAIRKNSPLLMNTLNSFLKSNRQGTLIGNILFNRYIRDFDWASNALAEEDYRRFNQLQHIFERYGETYGIEYLFAAAQGYQESRLNQNMRSPAGAIGVMQLLPSTAADKNVGIPNIEDVDANIHAGIKYMDFLRGRYFSDPDITPLNQALLALGAYNAGPARMIRIRNRAAEEGYDPNVWFDNVELVAAKEIGRETVQYVSNIYRYYLTYRMIAMQELVHAQAREAAGISGAPTP